MSTAVDDPQISPPDDEDAAERADLALPEGGASSLVITAASQGLLTFTADQTAPTPAQVAALAQIGIAVEGSRAVPWAAVVHLMHVSQVTGLDPWRGQLHLMPVWNEDDTGQRQKTFAVVTGIGALQGLAQSTGEYLGMDGPEFAGPDGEFHKVWVGSGAPQIARCRVRRKGREDTDWSEVYLSEVAPMVPQWRVLPDGRRERMADPVTGQEVLDLAPRWKRSPIAMLGKCAKAATIRDVFADICQGLYVHEEMERPAQLAEQREEEIQVSRDRRGWGEEYARLVKAGRGPGPVVVPGVVEGEPDGKAAGLANEVAARIEKAQEAARDAAPQVLNWADTPEDERCAWLYEELEHAAQVLGRDVTQLTAAHERVAGAWQGWGVDALANCVRPLRGAVAMMMARAGREREAGAYREVGDLIAPLDVLLGRVSG